MLSRYFLKRFFLYFIISLAGLIPLFGSCDVIVRLASIPFSFQILKLFGYMLPLVCLFAIPIATALAIGFTIGNMFSRGESVIFNFFSLARHRLESAVFFFAVVLFVFYLPFVFWWAPTSYWSGKQFLFRAAQQQIENLPAKRFHSIASRCTIFFKGKSTESNGDVVFKSILLMVREKDDKQYLVTARSGILKKGFLNLYHGTIYNKSAKNHCIATFKLLEIAFEKMFFQKMGEGQSQKAKFMPWEQLFQSPQSTEAQREVHKRRAQVLWQLLLPFLVFWAMMCLGRPKSNLLLSTIVGGTLFLISYISLNTAYYIINGTLISLIFFYSVPASISLLLYSFYYKAWR